MGYLPKNARVLAGNIRVNGQVLTDVPGSTQNRWRTAAATTMVYQEPGSALNPSMRIGEQLAEVFRYHEHLSKSDAAERAQAMLERVCLPDSGSMMRRYPHQLSGGQQQRVVIAMALAANPSVLILDEPTTGLDATVQAEIIDLVQEVRRSLDGAMLFISHNLALVHETCDRLAVLYAGRIVEEGPSDEVFAAPQHPYTMSLLRCVPSVYSSKRSQILTPIPGSLPRPGEVFTGCYFAPRCVLARDVCTLGEPGLESVGEGRRSRCRFAGETVSLPSVGSQAASTALAARTSDSLLEVHGLTKRYGNTVVCNDISLTIRRGEVLGLVGESGSGKTTLARCIAGLIQPTSGAIVLEGVSLHAKLARRPGKMLRSIQMVFQNPDSTLNQATLFDMCSLGQSGRLQGDWSVDDLALEVSLGARQLEQRTIQLSGGKQRAAIGRAIAGTPQIVLCDEPVSALDVSVQASVLSLLIKIQEHSQVAYLFISHDLAVVRYISDRVAVMYLGEICEFGESEAVFVGPHHPYTEALLASIPDVHRTAPREGCASLRGTIPSLTHPPSGCRFHTRCPHSLLGLCDRERPPWRDLGEEHWIRCHMVAWAGDTRTGTLGLRHAVAGEV